MLRYNKPIQGILLLFTAVMLILNQEDATRHLVETGLIGWQISRLLVFFLPGIELILAILLFFRLSWLKHLQWLLYFVLLIHLADLTIWLTHLSADDLNYKGNMLFDPVLGSAPVLILLLLGLNTYTRIAKHKESSVSMPWYFYIFLLPLLGSGIIQSKIYYTDFLAEEHHPSREIRADELKQITGVDDDTALIVMFDPTCHECQGVAKELSVMNPLEKPPIHAVFQADSVSVTRFLKTSGLKCIPHYIDYREFSSLADGVPNAFLLENNKIIAQRIGYNINLRFFDMILGMGK